MGGNAKRIVSEYPQVEVGRYHCRSMQYNASGQMWLIRSYTCTTPPTTGGPGAPENVTPGYVREFRYDTGQSRYLTRTLNWAMEDSSAQDTWHDYMANGIWADYEVSVTTAGQPVATPTAAYPHGAGVVCVDGGAGRSYFHGDLIGSTRFQTNSSGDTVGGMQYSAFGEALGPAEFGATTLATRYGYAGAYGYQADNPTGDADDIGGLIHVGARYYDPRIGRFIQRDPIGLFGGANTYVYCENNPVNMLDPTGETGASYILGMVAGAWFYGMRENYSATKIGALVGASVGAVISWYNFPGSGPWAVGKAASCLNRARNITWWNLPISQQRANWTTGNAIVEGILFGYGFVHGVLAAVIADYFPY